MRLPRTTPARLGLLAAVAAAVVAFIFVPRLLDSIDVEQILKDVSESLGAYTYLLVSVLAFLETGAFVGLVAPGETAVILGGAVAGQGETSVTLTIAIVWVSAWAGDTVSYLIGRRLGRGFILRHGPRLRISRERFARVESYFDRHGGKTIFIGRFIGIVRALAPFIAGSSGMRYRDVAPYSVLGTGLWAATFTVLGFLASQSIDEVVEIAERGTFWFGVGVGVVVGGILAFHHLRDPANRRRAVAEMERRPALRWLPALGRRLAPQARFVRERLTPGGLGLELTALLAALAVGLFTLVSYILIVSGDPGPTPGDSTALTVALDLRSGFLDDLSAVSSDVVSDIAIAIIFAVAAAVLAFRRRWPELAVLIAGTAIIAGAVPLLKELIERSGDPELAVNDDEFPSGGAAFSTLYAWIALTITLRLRPGVRGGALLIGAGIAVAALAGLSRAYLRVHYLSDVTAGWGLGVSAFALAAAVTLVIRHFRNNWRRSVAGEHSP